MNYHCRNCLWNHLSDIRRNLAKYDDDAPYRFQPYSHKVYQAHTFNNKRIRFTDGQNCDKNPIEQCKENKYPITLLHGIELCLMLFKRFACDFFSLFFYFLLDILFPLSHSFLTPGSRHLPISNVSRLPFIFRLDCFYISFGLLFKG